MSIKNSQNDSALEQANDRSRESLRLNYILLLLGILFWPAAVFVLWKSRRARQIDDQFVGSHYSFQYYTSIYFVLTTASIAGWQLIRFAYVVNTIQRPADELRNLINHYSIIFYVIFIWIIVRSVSGLYKLRKNSRIDRPASVWIWP